MENDNWPQKIKVVMDSGKEYETIMDLNKFLSFIEPNKGKFCLFGTGVYIDPAHISSFELPKEEIK